jgi:UDP-glucose 4-epimerase
MMETLPEIEKLLRQNGGKYLVFEQGKPKLVILDADRYRQFVVSENETEKILVTGGAGYIGSHTVTDLMEHGHEVIVLDNLSTGYLKSLPCPLIVGDLLDSDLMDKIFEQHRIKAVIHFAGSIIVEESVLNPQKYFNNNVLGSLNLLNAMVKHGVLKIVYSSSAAVYGNPDQVPISEEHPLKPLNPYGESKLMFEKILRWYHQAHGVSSVAYRYFNASGAWPEKHLGEAHAVETHLIPRILRVANKQDEMLKVFGSDYPTPDGTAVRDYIHVKDLARVHALALEKLEKEEGSFVYNVGTGRGYSVAQVVDMVMEVTGKMVAIESMERRPGDPAILVADAGKIKKELSFNPKHSDIQTIITDAWNWHIKRFSERSRPKVIQEAK